MTTLKCEGLQNNSRLFALTWFCGIIPIQRNTASINRYGDHSFNESRIVDIINLLVVVKILQLRKPSLYICEIAGKCVVITFMPYILFATVKQHQNNHLISFKNCEILCST